MERLSHDMNSLLASILGYASLVADHHLYGPDVDLEACGQTIVKQTTRLQRMVADAMTITRITENKLDLNLNPICLGTLLQAAVAEARERSGREISFTDESEGCPVPVDPFYLREAFNNLLDNALKFSAPGTPVEIGLKIDKASQRAEIRLEDYGAGIAAADLPRLFQPFGRILCEKTWAIPGNGLGLYIAREFVVRHNGEITVQSQLDHGSIFTISLPL